MPPAPIRVFVVDDHEIVRRGLVDLLETERGFTVVGEAASVRQALARIPATAADVVLLDVRLPDGNGVEVCRELLNDQPAPAVLMLTSYSDRRAEIDAVVAGAAGYFLKDIHGEALLTAIRRVAAGEVLVDPSLVNDPQRLNWAHRPDPGWLALTPQEQRVLSHIGEGCTNRQIARQMSLSERTVAHYVSSLLAKLGLERRAQAASYITHLQDQGQASSEQ